MVLAQNVEEGRGAIGETTIFVRENTIPVECTFSETPSTQYLYNRLDTVVLYLIYE